MTIVLSDQLPAMEILRQEGFDVSAASRAEPALNRLRIGLVNLMPRKEATELAFARLLAQTGHAIELTLVLPAAYEPRNTPHEHIERHYRRWPDIRDERFDAMIFTGAPVETLPYEDVAYWSEFRAMAEWAREHVGAALYICWAAQAALYVFRGIDKTLLDEKAFGIFEQAIVACSPLTRGLGRRFPVPVSRHSAIERKRLDAAGLRVLAESGETGACIVDDCDNRAVCIFDHLEYAADTLSLEYERDRHRGLSTRPPRNAGSGLAWEAYAALFYRNWLDGIVARREVSDAEERSISWLFAGDDRHLRHRPMVVFQSTNRPHILSEVLNRLAPLGLTPLSARVRTSERQLTSVVVESLDLAPELMESVAASLLVLSGARRVMVSLPDGSGGIFRSRPGCCSMARAA